MFIDDDEARLRLKSPSNLLARVDRSPVDLPYLDLNTVFLPVGSPPIPPPESLESVGNPPLESTEKIDQEKQEIDPNIDPFDALKYMRALDKGLDIRGRKTGIRNRSTEENAAVGLSSLLLGSTASEQMFGVAPPQQSLIKQGRTGSQDKQLGRAPKQELLDSIYYHGRKAADKAFQKIDIALDAMTSDKIRSTKTAVDLARIATSMARIVQAVTPKDDEESERGVHFHIYHPEQESIESYDTVEVRPDGTVTVERERGAAIEPTKSYGESYGGESEPEGPGAHQEGG